MSMAWWCVYAIPVQDHFAIYSANGLAMSDSALQGLPEGLQPVEELIDEFSEEGRCIPSNCSSICAISSRTSRCHLHSNLSHINHRSSSSTSGTSQHRHHHHSTSSCSSYHHTSSRCCTSSTHQEHTSRHTHTRSTHHHHMSSHSSLHHSSSSRCTISSTHLQLHSSSRVFGSGGHLRLEMSCFVWFRSKKLRDGGVLLSIH
mmetsp:Transcript_20572/g.51386  ORF Transcript_20572/g.51386 Transcript_20572/m.51386 type:complete len:202 (-) Transcript_20572:692-1297(-)